MLRQAFGSLSGDILQINKVYENKKQYLNLLFLADEQESMIDRYLARGELFVLMQDNLALAVAVVTNEGSSICELKNLAVEPEYQRCGYGRKMVEYLAEHYGGKYNTMLVGTGETPGVLAFYAKCGFVVSHRIKNFFIDNYNKPIIEDGVQLVDMVVLKQPLWVLQTARLGFRCLCYDDREALRPILGDAETMYAWEYGFSDEQIDEWINKNIVRYKNDGYAYFAAICKNTGELIGLIGLINEDIEGEFYLGLGYIIARQHWNNGYAAEGTEAFVNYAFNTIDVKCVIADIRTENAASCKVAHKLGMRIIGRHVKVHNGKKMPHIIYALDKPVIVAEEKAIQTFS